MIVNGSSLFDEGLSLENCLERVQVLFYDDSTNSESFLNLDYLDELLFKLRRYSGRQNAVVKSIATFVRDVATCHPNACHLLLIHLPYLPDPIPFVDIMASMFCVASPALVAEAVMQLKLLPERDKSLLLPVISTIADLPLPAILLSELYQLAEGAIDILDETELPALFRTLLKSLCPQRARRALLKLRNEMTTISESSVALLVEVMWEVLPSSSGASEVLLDQIVKDQEIYSLKQPSLSDLAIVLILTSNIGALKQRARNLFTVWLQQDTFPFTHLELVLSLRRSNESWERMVPAVWKLCLWTLEGLADYSHDVSISETSLPNKKEKKKENCYNITNGKSNNVIYSSNKEGLSSIILQLCECMPSMREKIVTTLLGKCYTCDDNTIINTNTNMNMNNSYRGHIKHNDRKMPVDTRLNENDTSTSWLSSIPSLGFSSAEYGILFGHDNMCNQNECSNENSEGRNETEKNEKTAIKLKLAQARDRSKNQKISSMKAHSQAFLAATVLQYIVRAHPEIGASVLSSIMDRLTPSSQSSGGRVTLPSPAILHCLVTCVINATSSSPQIENTVFIVIQKLLAASQLSRSEDGGGDCNLLSLLSSSHNSSANGNFNQIQIISNNHHNNNNNNNNNFSRVNYSTGTVACFLSGHILLRKGLTLNVTDFRAVLTWLDRAFDSFLDISIACYLDTLLSSLLVIKKIMLLKKSKIFSSKNSQKDFHNNCDENEEEMNKFNLIILASKACLSKVFKFQSLILSTSDYNSLNKIEMESTYITEIFENQKLKKSSTISKKNNFHSQSQEFSDALFLSSSSSLSPHQSPSNSLIWNIAGLSANLISMRSDSRDQSEGHFDFMGKAKNDINALTTSVFWVLQRSAALHSLLCSINNSNSNQNRRHDASTTTSMPRGIKVNNNKNNNISNNSDDDGNNDDNNNNDNNNDNDNNDHINDTGNCCGVSTSTYRDMPSICVLLSKSEVDLSEKIPWMADSKEIADKGRNNEKSANQVDGSLQGCSQGGRIGRQSTSTSTSTRSSSHLRNPNTENLSTVPTFKNRNVSTDISPSTGLKSSIHLHVWSCGAADGIESLSFVRPPSLTAFDCLRLSWERALTAAVLLGYHNNESPDVSLLPSEQSENSVTVLLDISRILCQTHMARFMLRCAHAGCDTNQISSAALPGGRGASSGGARIPKGSENNQKYINNNRSEDRSSRERSRGYSGAEQVGGNSENPSRYETKRHHQSSIQKDELAIDRKLMVLAVQKRTVQCLLNRIEGFISAKSLLSSLEILLSTSVPDTEHCAVFSNNSNPPGGSTSPSILTDVGLAVVTCFSLRILTGQLEVPELNRIDINKYNTADSISGSGSRTEQSSSIGVCNAVKRLRSSEEVFYSLMEINGGVSHDCSFPDTSSSSSSSSSSHLSSSSSQSYTSSSSSSSSYAIPNEGSSTNHEKLLNPTTLLSSLLSLAPLLFFYEEKLRKASALFPSYLSPPTLTKKIQKKKLNSSLDINVKSGVPCPSIQNNSTGKERSDESNYGRIDSDKNTNPSIDYSCKLHGLLGSSIDRSGCAVLLLVLYALLNYVIIGVIRNSSGDLHVMAKNKYLKEIINKMKKLSVIFHTDESNNRNLNENTNMDMNMDENNNSGDDDHSPTYDDDDSSDNITMNNDKKKGKLEIIILYDIIEKQILNVQDVTLATAGFRLINSIAECSLLSKRLASVSWMLLLTLHTQQTMLSTNILDDINANNEVDDDIKTVPGTDGIWPHLASYESMSICPSLHKAIKEINNLLYYNYTILKSKAIKTAISLYQSSFNVVYNKNKHKHKDYLFNSNSILSFKRFWSFWWIHEDPSIRVFGIIKLLMEIFRFHTLPNNDNDKKEKEIIKNDKNCNKRKKNISKNYNLHSFSSSFSTSSTTSSTSTIGKFVFHSLSPGTSEPLFMLALNSFPALFLLAEPKSKDFLHLFYSQVPQGVFGPNFIDESSNPFRCFIDICKSFIWFLQQLEELIEDGTQLRFILRTSSSCVRTTRAILLCVESCAVGGVAWRNAQPVPNKIHRNIRKGNKGNKIAKIESKIRKSSRDRTDTNTDSDDNENDSDNDSDDNTDDDDNNDDDDDINNNNKNDDVNDIGCLEYLATMLDWTMALTHRVIRYAEILKEKMLLSKNGLQIPRELIRSNPQLQYQAERLAAKIIRVAKAHSLHLRDPKELFDYIENGPQNVPQYVPRNSYGVGQEKYNKNSSIYNDNDNDNDNYNNSNVNNKKEDKDKNENNENKRTYEQNLQKSVPSNPTSKNVIKKAKNTSTVGHQWDYFIKDKALEFSTYHQRTLSKCTEDSSWRPIRTHHSQSYDDENSHHYNNKQFNEKIDEKNEDLNNEDDMESENDSYSSSVEESDSSGGDDVSGFKAVVRGTKNSQGWGLYQIHGDDQDSDCEEVKKIEEEEEEEEERTKDMDDKKRDGDKNVRGKSDEKGKSGKKDTVDNDEDCVVKDDDNDDKLYHKKKQRFISPPEMNTVYSCSNRNIAKKSDNKSNNTKDNSVHASDHSSSSQLDNHATSTLYNIQNDSIIYAKMNNVHQKHDSSGTSGSKNILLSKVNTVSIINLENNASASSIGSMNMTVKLNNENDNDNSNNNSNNGNSNTNDRNNNNDNSSSNISQSRKRRTGKGVGDSMLSLTRPCP